MIFLIVTLKVQYCSVASFRTLEYSTTILVIGIFDCKDYTVVVNLINLLNNKLLSVHLKIKV
jgi:hypothetical protein